MNSKDILKVEDFEAIEETQYLTKNPINNARLTDAIDEVEAMIASQKVHTE